MQNKTRHVSSSETIAFKARVGFESPVLISAVAAFILGAFIVYRAVSIGPQADEIWTILAFSLASLSLGLGIALLVHRRYRETQTRALECELNALEDRAEKLTTRLARGRGKAAKS
jgi:hypothetical protein